MTLQDTLSITYRNATDKDKLKVVYGAIIQNIVGQSIFTDLLNTNYSTTPTAGGSVNVKRMKFSTVRNYGTARENQEGDKLQNNGVDILINTQKEIVDEVENKDLKWFLDGGRAALLAELSNNKAASMNIFLEEAYFVALQTAAATYDVSSITDADSNKQIAKRLSALFRKAESTTGENVNKIDRSLLICTVTPEIYDALEDHLVTLPNPRNGGADAEFYKRVEIRVALRQTVDAIVQVRGSMAMPMVIDNYDVTKVPFGNAFVDELYFFYGIGAIMPECIYKAAISSDNNISA